MKTDPIQTLPVFSEYVANLCDTLRDTRADIEVLKVIPGPAAKMVELKIREENCLYLLREARAFNLAALEAA